MQVQRVWNSIRDALLLLLCNQFLFPSHSHCSILSHYSDLYPCRYKNPRFNFHWWFSTRRRLLGFYWSVDLWWRLYIMSNLNDAELREDWSRIVHFDPKIFRVWLVQMSCLWVTPWKFSDAALGASSQKILMLPSRCFFRWLFLAGVVRDLRANWRHKLSVETFLFQSGEWILVLNLVLDVAEVNFVPL